MLFFWKKCNDMHTIDCSAAISKFIHFSILAGNNAWGDIQRWLNMLRIESHQSVKDGMKDLVYSLRRALESVLYVPVAGGMRYMNKNIASFSSTEGPLHLGQFFRPRTRRSLHRIKNVSLGIRNC